VAFDKPYLAILLTPLPTVALLMTMLLDSTIALFHVVLLGLLMFVIGESNVRFVVVSLFGAIAGILAWRSATRASDVRNLIGSSGLKIGISSSIALMAFLLLDSESFSTMDFEQILMVAGFGLLNGVFSGILANGVLPYMESMFSLATSSRLLELADLSQPLLKKLADEAPGSYQHSVAVATLAEAAANGINADPLLTKIGAYFHDIGKLKRPMYFSENQSDENRHDQVTPYMSSLILIGHIRDGLDLGREYGLPERVLSIMSQHHGTTLISYFYEEAKKNKEGEEVNEERFRYPGPKPQTKEAAIIMLADSVEAAARTLPQHTHSKIEGLVQKIIEHKLNDENQLDESDLTLKDIEKIEQIFVRTLTSMYHGRIDYPGKLSNQQKGVADGSSDK
jgi:putative nucleotidyltransferase with HDIG domain